MVFGTIDTMGNCYVWTQFIAKITLHHPLSYMEMSSTKVRGGYLCARLTLVGTFSYAHKL